MGSDGPTILIVEDEGSLVRLYRRWLDADYDVRTATTGEEALEQLDDEVEVILLDRLMPGMSGDEVLAEIRDRTEGCRVAMVTAVEPDFDVIRMGFDDYLTKPVERGVLLDSVDRLLARGSYADLERELYSLVSKQAALTSSNSVDELDGHDEYDQLREQVSELDDELDTTLPDLDSGDLIAMVREFEERKRERSTGGGG